MITIGRRNLRKAAGAVFHKPNYVAAANMLRVYRRPADMYRRYLFATGTYPLDVSIRSPVGDLVLTAFCHDDVLTINEVFCRIDYPATAKETVFVDFGSNIGISAAYFLTRARESFAYLYEPFPPNIAKLKRNIDFLDGRFELNEVAVGLTSGDVEFGWEPTGRYGGVGRPTGNTMTVEAVDAMQELRRILGRHGYIDILKIDVETLEAEIVDALTPDILTHIDKIYVEYPFSSNVLSETHAYRQYGSIAQFTKRT